jgi:hypothetical protein
VYGGVEAEYYYYNFCGGNLLSYCEFDERGCVIISGCNGTVVAGCTIADSLGGTIAPKEDDPGCRVKIDTAAVVATVVAAMKSGKFILHL